VTRGALQAGGGTAVVQVDGQPSGALRACFSSLAATDTGRVLRGTLTLSLQGGQVVTDVTVTETESDTVIDQEVSGDVVEARGRYSGTGLISGGGRITIEGTDVQPDLTYVVSLDG